MFYKIVALFIIGIALLTAAIYYIIKPSTKELMTQEPWCVDHIYFEGKNVPFKTIDLFRIKGLFTHSDSSSLCPENIEFDIDGNLTLPGINSYELSGKWKLRGDKIQLTTDTLSNIFNGSYDIDLASNSMILRSEHTIIHAHKDKIKMQNKPLRNRHRYR